jgi:Amt family ammonium transporter
MKRYGVAGLMGGLLTGVLANPDMLLYIGTDKDAPGINATGWYYGNFTQLKYKAIAALFIIVLNAVATFAIHKIIGMFVPLRMDEKSLQPRNEQCWLARSATACFVLGENSSRLLIGIQG